MAVQVKHKKIVKVIHHTSSVVDDLLAVEEPLQIKLLYWNNLEPLEKNISVTMRTPGNDFELAAGFLFTEGIINDGSSIDYVTYCSKALLENNENVVKVLLKKDAKVNLPAAERNFYISGSCGVCGKTAIEAIQQSSCYPISFDFFVTYNIILALKTQMQEAQVNFRYTGGIHGCALFDQQGQMQLMREDIGRHNALDKLIGFGVLKNDLPFEKKILLLSGRISFELIQKAAMAGIGIVCGVGAPSSLAVETAEKSNITLIGFLKDNSMNIYTHNQRIVQ